MGYEIHMLCFFFFLINGVATPFFHSKQGLRQGCPLSPLLFLLVVEFVRHFLEATKISGSFKGLPISQVLYISHLLFVDDILIFCDGSRRDVLWLESFQKDSRMTIHEEKYTITFENMEEWDIRFLATRLSF